MLKTKSHATSDYQHLVTSSSALDHVLHKFSCSQDILIVEMLACKLKSDRDTVEELGIVFGIALALTHTVILSQTYKLRIQPCPSRSRVSSPLR